MKSSLITSKLTSKELKIRYIKLGEGGKWANDCFDSKVLRLGFNSGSEEIYTNGIKGQWEKIRQYWINEGKKSGTATSYMNQTKEFFVDTGNTLWITFENGFLYYGFTDGDKIKQDITKSRNGEFTTTRCMDVNGWLNIDFNGKPLQIQQLSGALTQIVGFQGTVCSFKPEVVPYIKHRICGTISDEIAKTETAKTQLQECLKPLIQSLTAKDFEILISLIFANSGWRRTSATGGTQKIIDFELENPVLNESAFVQVKTKTSQKEFDSYVEKKRMSYYARMFYVYHEGKIISNEEDISVWDLNKVTEQVLQNGLIDWVISHSK